MSQPPMPPGPPTQPEPHRGPSRECSRRRTVASTPTGRRPTPRRRQPTVDAGWTAPWTAGLNIPPGWTPPPWSPDAADTRPFWRRIPAGLLVAGALVLRWALVAGWYFRGVTPTTGAKTVTVTQSAERAGDRRERLLGGNPHDYKLRVVDLRVGDCFDLKDESADQIEDVKAVPCTTEHEFEVFYVGAMGEGSYPTDDAFGRYVTRNCLPAFGAYIGKAVRRFRTRLSTGWPRPTMPGGRAIGPCSAPPTIRVSRALTRSLRGTQQ